MRFTLLVLLLFVTFNSGAFSKNVKDMDFSLRTGAYVYHFLGNNGQYTEGFDNQFLTAGFGISESSEILVGTLKNSYGDRCVFLGLGKDWHKFNDKVVFEGIYSYVGEFFFDEFRDCGRKGVYRSFDQNLGVGFAPYIYHGIKYHLTSYLALEAGIVFPRLAVLTAVWKF